MPRLSGAAREGGHQRPAVGDHRFPRRVLRHPAATFYPAEEYHQDYDTKNPVQYRFYKRSCGRERRLDEPWGKG